MNLSIIINKYAIIKERKFIMGKSQRTIKPWEELTIADDYMFKLVMRHPRICQRLIEKILNIKINHIKYLETEKTLESSYTGKGIRLDVYVEGDNVIYDIEMQVRDYGDTELAYRTRYYQSMIDKDILSSGTKRYTELKKSFIIFLCPFAMFDGKRHMYTFRSYCSQDKNIILDDGTTKIFLCSDGALDDVSPDIKAFLDFMKGLPVTNNFVDEIRNLINDLKHQEKEKVSYMTFEMKMQEARNDGEKIAERRTAKRMLAKNRTVDEIMEYVDLTQEEIQELAKETK